MGARVGAIGVIMADEPSTDIRSTPTVLYEHYCQHPRCKTWGFFGYDNRMARTTDWFCGEHRPDKTDITQPWR